jgi:pyruvate dehydrogenase E2 component (dihydrolipoamide acetyltransferase)
MDILMPQLGETVTEGKITIWFKSIGDAVKPGDNLFEIETDKVAMEVPATAAGVLTEIRVGIGDSAPVGAVVAVLAGGLSSAEGIPPPLAGEGREGAVQPVTAPPSVLPPPSPVTPMRPLPGPPPQAGAAARAAPRRIMLDPFREVRTPERNYGPARIASGMVATPLARRLAGEAGIDLGTVVPSGPHGRIVGSDVETAIAAADGIMARGPVLPDRVKALYEVGSYDEIALDGTRRATVARLVEAANIPQFRLTADIAVERLENVREEANVTALKDHAANPAFRLSPDDFLVRALALALARVPAANAVWAGDRILRFKHSDIGVAVPSEDGGFVMPVICGADKKSLLDISTELAELAASARAGKLQAAELQGGASGICNLGAFGVRAFDAIVNPPHATLLAVGAPVRRSIESEDGIRFVTAMTATLVCDQRVVDAALGAELLGTVRHFIEHPVGLMI